MGIDHRDYQLTEYYRQNHQDMVESNKRGKGTHKFNKTDNKTLEAYASYLHDFDQHRVDAVAGWSFYETGGEEFSMTNANFTVDGIGPWDMSSGTDLSDGLASMSSGKDPRERLMSLFARVNYDYADRYMATASFRREGSSKFGPNNRWGTSGPFQPDGASQRKTS